MLRGTGFSFGSGLACILLTFSIVPLSPAFSAEVDQENVAATLERAEGERLSMAIGHYARTRALLLQALREFDKGRQLARPDSLIDSEEWRATLLNRTEELERVLSPQPRASKGGVRFDSAAQLLNAGGDEAAE